jgi:DNA-binding NtrC family response regulator
MGETIKVLVVDDDRRMVKTICDILKAKGFEAVSALTGEEAVEMVRADIPDCVLMDVKMPGIDGVEALRMMKEMVPDLPVVLMSAYATGDQAEEAKRQGAYSVLTKPIDIQQLLSFLSLLRKEESILVVDDDPQFCRTLKDILQSRNYQVETEDDPEKVLGHMEQKYELVVVLDLKLGDADGLDVLRDIRSRYPTKPVVLVTGYSGEMVSVIEKGLQIGAYTCLYKPFVTEELIGIIEEISLKKLRSFLGEPFQEQENEV